MKLNGHPTWVHVPRARREVVTLLHGGLSSSASMLRRFRGRLSKDFDLAAFDRRGHGRTADRPGEAFHYADMAKETIAFLEYLGRPSHLVGHSDGGVVALHVALDRPDLIDRVVLIGTNFHHRGLVAMPELALDGPEFEEFAAGYVAGGVGDRAAASEIWRKSLELTAREPTLKERDLARITRPVLVVSGDDDVARLEHTVALYRALAQGQLAVLPASSHALLKEHPGLSTRIIRHFLLEELPPRTLYPIRRAGASRRSPEVGTG